MRYEEFFILLERGLLKREKDFPFFAFKYTHNLHLRYILISNRIKYNKEDVVNISLYFK